jgi:hypothetical protein
MEIVENKLIGNWAVPRDHPITSLNNAPWPIQFMKIIQKYSNDNIGIKWEIYIRGEGAMWFNANSCFISTKEECEDYIRIHDIK